LSPNLNLLDRWSFEPERVEKPWGHELIYRIHALEDTTVLEVSTPHVHDVVRLEDSYGRKGTSEP
jgi:hypothetical protein